MLPCARGGFSCVGVVAGQPRDTTFARVVPATCRSSHRLVSAMPPGTSPSSERFPPTCTHSSPCPPAGRCRVSAYVSFAPVVFRSVACRTVFHWRREAGYMKLIQTIPNILEVVCKRVPLWHGARLACRLAILAFHSRKRLPRPAADAQPTPSCLSRCVLFVAAPDLRGKLCCGVVAVRCAHGGKGFQDDDILHLCPEV